MATSREDIKNWFERERKEANTHMLVCCDTFDYSDYPVYVTNKQNVRDIFNEYDNKSMQRVIEVYSYNMPLEEQLNEHRAMHLD